MAEDFTFMTATEMLGLIRRKQVSPVEVVEAALRRLERVEPQLNSFVTITPDLALASARCAEREVMKGDTEQPLLGLPISVKDLIAVGGVRQTFGSRTSKDNIAPNNAPSVERVIAAGACIVGKTTTSEFGCKAAGDSPLTGITRNPWNLSKTPGGSSCGAAASVAAGITPFALGTDGGGSIREPSAFTGIFGVKAQFARVPVFPVAATPTLAHVGPLARSVRDAALLLSTISGHDRRDPFSIAEDIPNFVAACDQPVVGMRIAWSPTLGYAKPTHEVVSVAEQALSAFTDLGCQVEMVDKVIEEDPVDMWTAEFYAGVGTRLRKPLRESPELLDPAVVGVLSNALDQTLEEYYALVFKRYTYRETMRQFFEKYDVLMTPQTPVVAFDVGLDMPLGFPDRNIVSWQYYTYPFNLTGQPAASVPAGFTTDGLPVGLQIVARINRETDLFRAASALEAARPWGNDRPSQWDDGNAG